MLLADCLEEFQALNTIRLRFPLRDISVERLSTQGARAPLLTTLPTRGTLPCKKSTCYLCTFWTEMSESVSATNNSHLKKTWAAGELAQNKSQTIFIQRAKRRCRRESKSSETYTLKPISTVHQRQYNPEAPLQQFMHASGVTVQDEGEHA